MDVTLTHLEPFNYVFQRSRTTIPQISKAADATIGPLLQAARAAGVPIEGPPIFIYLGADGNPATEFDLEIGFAVAGDAPPVPGFDTRTTSAFKALAVQYVGGMPGIHTAYGAAFERMQADGLAPAGEAREIYRHWVDFNSPENITEIQLGVR